MQPANQDEPTQICGKPPQCIQGCVSAASILFAFSDLPTDCVIFSTGEIATTRVSGVPAVPVLSPAQTHTPAASNALVGTMEKTAFSSRRPALSTLPLVRRQQRWDHFRRYNVNLVCNECERETVTDGVGTVVYNSSLLLFITPADTEASPPKDDWRRNHRSSAAPERKG